MNGEALRSGLRWSMTEEEDRVEYAAKQPPECRRPVLTEPIPARMYLAPPTMWLRRRRVS
jgi:hypothetical protein